MFWNLKAELLTSFFLYEHAKFIIVILLIIHSLEKIFFLTTVYVMKFSLNLNLYNKKENFREKMAFYASYFL